MLSSVKDDGSLEARGELIRDSRELRLWKSNNPHSKSFEEFRQFVNQQTQLGLYECDNPKVSKKRRKEVKSLEKIAALLQVGEGPVVDFVKSLLEGDTKKQNKLSSTVEKASLLAQLVNQFRWSALNTAFDGVKEVTCRFIPPRESDNRSGCSELHSDGPKDGDGSVPEYDIENPPPRGEDWKKGPEKKPEEEKPTKSKCTWPACLIVLMMITFILFGAYFAVRRGIISIPFMPQVVEDLITPDAPSHIHVVGKETYRENGWIYGKGDFVGDFNYDNQLLRDVPSDPANRLSVAIGSATKDYSPIYRHPDAPSGPKGYLELDDGGMMYNAVQMMQQSSEKYGKQPCLGYRPFKGPKWPEERLKNYKFESYSQVWGHMQNFGKGLAVLGIEPGSVIGIFGSNRPEWTISLLGLWSQGYIGTALYDAQSEEDRQHVISNSDMVAISCEKKNLDALVKSLTALQDAGKHMPRQIIVWGPKDGWRNAHEGVQAPEQEKFDIALGGGVVEVMELWSNVVENGKNAELEPQNPQENEQAFIMYTSGTTGNPKGAVLTHGNIFASVASFSRYIQEKGSGVDFKKPQAHMSFLPLAHAFEQSFQILLLSMGGKIGFGSGKPHMIPADWIALQPTVICGVPRVYEKTIEKLRASISGKWYLPGFRTMFAKAEHSARMRIKTGASWGWSDTGYNTTVWGRVRGSMGWGSVKVVVSGASPLPADYSEFLECLVGHPVLEGYGMTETFALGTHTVSSTNKRLNVGIPFDNIEIRLKSLPKHGYKVDDKINVDGSLIATPRGEVQFRGPSVFQGYYKDNGFVGTGLGSHTSGMLSASDNDYKWLSTGDIGRINPNGTMSIIGRTKELIKNKLGEYIAPRKIETMYGRSPAVNQIWVYGNSYKSSIMAVVVPNARWAVEQLQAAGHWTKADWPKGLSSKEMCSEEFVKAFKKTAGKRESRLALKTALLVAMMEHDAGVPRHCKIKDIHIEIDLDSKMLQGFHVNNQRLTPTSKLRPSKLLEDYRGELKALYEANNEPLGPSETW